MGADDLIAKLRRLKKLGVSEFSCPDFTVKWPPKADVIRAKPLPDGADDEDELTGRPSSWYAEFARRKDEEARRAVSAAEPPRRPA